MDSFDAKFGSIPLSMTPNRKLFMTCGVQFAVCITILLMIQPPFVTHTPGDFETAQISMTNIIILSLLCVVFTAFVSMR